MSRLVKFALPITLGNVLLLVYLGTGVAQHKTATGTEHEASYRCDTPGIQLEGTLIERKVYGPPGFGETPARDARGTILVLKLSHGISVEPKANAEASGNVNLDPAKDVCEMQLFVSRSQAADARKHLDRVVNVTGTLNESITASQYTKVWMDVGVLDPK